MSSHTEEAIDSLPHDTRGHSRDNTSPSEMGWTAITPILLPPTPLCGVSLLLCGVYEAAFGVPTAGIGREEVE